MRLFVWIWIRIESTLYTVHFTASETIFNSFSFNPSRWWLNIKHLHFHQSTPQYVWHIAFRHKGITLNNINFSTWIVWVNTVNHKEKKQPVPIWFTIVQMGIHLHCSSKSDKNVHCIQLICTFNLVPNNNHNNTCTSTYVNANVLNQFHSHRIK